MPTGDFAIRAAFRRLYRKRKEPTPALILEARAEVGALSVGGELVSVAVAGYEVVRGFPWSGGRTELGDQRLH